MLWGDYNLVVIVLWSGNVRRGGQSHQSVRRGPSIALVGGEPAPGTFRPGAGTFEVHHQSSAVSSLLPEVQQIFQKTALLLFLAAHSLSVSIPVITAAFMIVIVVITRARLNEVGVFCLNQVLQFAAVQKYAAAVVAAVDYNATALNPAHPTRAFGAFNRWRNGHGSSFQ